MGFRIRFAVLWCLVLNVAIVFMPIVAGGWIKVAEHGARSMAIQPDSFLVAGRGNTFAYRMCCDDGGGRYIYLKGDWGIALLMDFFEFYASVTELTVTADAHAYMMYNGKVRYLIQASPSVYPPQWGILGSDRPWYPDYKSPRLAAQNGPAGLVFLAFMSANDSISVLQNSIERNSTWSPLSFPIVTNGSQYAFPSFAIQGPTLKLSNTGRLYMLVADAGCSSNNASVLRLVNDSFVFAGQRCFCSATTASLVVPDDGFALTVIDTSNNAIWQLSADDNTWRVIASGFTFQAERLIQYAALPRSSNLVALGALPRGVAYLSFSNCSNRWDSQAEYQVFDWYMGGPLVSLADDGRPFAMFLTKTNPYMRQLPGYEHYVVSYSGDMPLPERTTSCIPCPDVSPGPNCSSCPVNYQPTVGGQCARCVQGYYGNGGSQKCGCAPGFVASAATLPCTQCTGYTYMPYKDGTSCLRCPLTTPITNGDKTECLPCPAGSVPQKVPVQLPWGCGLCNAGSYASQPGMWLCDLCPPGTFASTFGRNSCDLCPAGTYNENYGVAACTKCADASKIGSTVGNVDCEGKKSSAPSNPLSSFIMLWFVCLLMLELILDV